MKKRSRIIAIIIAAVIVVGVLFALPINNAAAIPAFEEATIMADDVNMRLRPTSDSPSVLKLDNGTRVGVFCEETDGWYRIIYGNYRGYVSKDFVFLSSTDTMVGNITEDECEVHLTAVDFSEAIGTLSAGAGVTITDIQGDSYYIVADGVEGFVSKEDVQLSSGKTAATLLKEGMSGVEVKKMQTALRERGFLGAGATGYYGDMTKAAVVSYQQAMGIGADGIAGEQTLSTLYDENNTVKTRASKLGIDGGVSLMPWDEAKNIITRYSEFTVTDVNTGISWRERRFGGWYHADCEPLTAEDTRKMKEACGGSWSWDRRAVWVTSDNGITIAASMNCMPHMVNPTPSNKFDGHHCIHFKDSMVHENSKECPRHQAMVMYAYEQAQRV